MDARWTKEAERKVLRKVDLKVCLFVCICFAALQLDRGNVSTARGGVRSYRRQALLGDEIGAG